MVEIFKSSTFDVWLSGLRDVRGRAKILVRIDRLAAGNPGDHKSVGSGIIELRLNEGPGYRVYYMTKGTQMIVLLAGGEVDAIRRHRKGESYRDGMELIMPETFTRFDAAEYLKTDADVAAYLDAAAEDGDYASVAAALGTVARAKGMSQLARDTGLTREGLYKALSADGNPSFATVVIVAKSLGFRVSFEATNDNKGAKEEAQLA